MTTNNDETFEQITKRARMVLSDLAQLSPAAKDAILNVALELNRYTTEAKKEELTKASEDLQKEASATMKMAFGSILGGRMATPEDLAKEAQAKRTTALTPEELKEFMSEDDEPEKKP
jgi:hypothetical protein